MPTFFKDAQPSMKVQRALRKRTRDDSEDAAKARVRRRDKGCRFPYCGCRQLGLALEVSHNEHKGMGGNPSGVRSNTALLMQLCRERHKANPFSVHNGTIAWEPLTSFGANGPVRWLVDVRLLQHYAHGTVRPVRAVLVEVAREQDGLMHVKDEYLFVVSRLGLMTL